MKKLMIAAAAAAMIGGAYAECGEGPTPEQVYDNNLVYQFKASLKTTKGVLLTTNDKAAGHCGEITPGGCFVYRTKDTMSLAGWLYATDDCTCNGWQANAVVWDTKRKQQLDDAAFVFMFCNVMGKNQTEAETKWQLTGTFNYNTIQTQTITLDGAGLGSFSKKTATFKFSGNCAGTMGASWDLKTDTIEDCCIASQIYVCDNLAEAADSDTVVYGSWSMKYNASATKSYTQKRYLKLPKYVTLAE